MKLGLRIFLCYLAIFAGCVYFPVHRTLRTLRTLRTRYQESVEERNRRICMHPLLEPMHAPSRLRSTTCRRRQSISSCTSRMLQAR